MEALDETDLQLIDVLSKNARITGVELAKILDVHPSTVARKIKSLEDRGVIKGYLAIVDMEKMGNVASSVITIKLTGGADIQKILDELIDNENVCNIFETMGNYDLFLTCCSKDEGEIYELIKEIRSMGGVLFVDFSSIVSRKKLLKTSLCG